MPSLTTGGSQVVSASPFHTVTEFQVFLSANPLDQETYSTGQRNEQGSELYAPSKVGIDKLFSAAGVETVRTQGEEVEPLVWTHHYTGELVKPDGTKHIDTKSKTIDLRIGGTRWAKEREKNMDWLISKWGPKNGHPRQKKERWIDFLIRVKLVMEDEAPDDLEQIERIAEEKATRFCTQMAQYGAELAETGAMERFARAALGLKTYTVAELKEPFTGYRSRYDWSALQAKFGDEVSERLMLTKVAKDMGLEIDPAKLLENGQEKEEVVIEGEVENPFFNQPSAEIIQAIMSYFQDDGNPDTMTQHLFDKPLDKINAGEADLITVYLRKREDLIDQGVEESERRVVLEKVIEQIGKCWKENRFWTTEDSEGLK